MRRLALGVLVAGAVVGCAGASAGAGGEGGGAAHTGPAPAEDAPGVAQAASIYRRIGRLASAEPLPFVGTVAFAGGTGDTALAIVALSLANRSLTFEREPNGYTARYRVDISLAAERGAPLTVAREEVVRVSTLQETTRTDESVLFQQSFKVLPGRQHVIVSLRDMASGVEGRAEADYQAPAFAAGTTSEPILAYQAKGRGERSEPLQLVVNPRGTIGLNGDTLLVYVEGYSLSGAQAVPFEVRSQTDSVIYRDSLRFRGGRPVESQVLRVTPDSLSLGEVRLVVGSGAAERRVSALVSVTPGSVVTDYDQMLAYLRYWGPNPYLDSLRKAPPADRARLWRAFVRSTDQNPKTPQNEQLDEYFARVATANAQIRDEGIPGWRTDRGEVFIVLGPPDEASEAGQMSSRLIRWYYPNYRLTLYFADESGFGRYRLIQQSRADFDRLVARLRRGRGG
ncbi:MAG TPA: GWxTD domain-containing protein [Gemmatimonadales bacterium]|nr:GWxTD domain-containing protein [Gemmatimonadales bacterium]